MYVAKVHSTGGWERASQSGRIEWVSHSEKACTVGTLVTWRGYGSCVLVKIGLRIPPLTAVHLRVIYPAVRWDMCQVFCHRVSTLLPSGTQIVFVFKPQSPIRLIPHAYAMCALHSEGTPDTIENHRLENTHEILKTFLKAFEMLLKASVFLNSFPSSCRWRYEHSANTFAHSDDLVDSMRVTP